MNRGERATTREAIRDAAERARYDAKMGLLEDYVADMGRVLSQQIAIELAQPGEPFRGLAERFSWLQLRIDDDGSPAFVLAARAARQTFRGIRAKRRAAKRP